MVDATTAASATTDSTALGRARLAENFDTFLTLLTTQLKNQDPLSPLDSNEFTQQLTQMTGVEQQLATNDLLKQLVTNTASGLSTAVSLIGKQVRAVSDDASLSNGKASWTYKLGPDPADVKLEVLDSQGNVVRAVAASDAKEGENSFAWDGKDQFGNKLPDGTYTLRITAKDSTGADVDHTTYRDGVVNAVEQSDGQTLLTIDGAKIPWGQITSVAQASTTTADNTTTNTDQTTS